MIPQGICSTCSHRISYDSCEAFAKIPPAVLLGSLNHRQPIDGDNGIQYEEIQEERA